MVMTNSSSSISYFFIASLIMLFIKKRSSRQSCGNQKILGLVQYVASARPGWSTSAQQDDPLGPLLFLLVLLLSFLALILLASWVCDIWMTIHLGLLFLLYCHALAQVWLAYQFIQVWAVLALIAHFLTFLIQSNTLILHAVVWNYWGLLFGDLLNVVF